MAERNSVTPQNFTGLYRTADVPLKIAANSVNLGINNHYVSNLSVCASESKGASASHSPFSRNTSAQGTCVKVRKQGKYRYSSSPLGKRFDIYETSETEGDDQHNQI